MGMDRNTVIGFVLLGILLFAYLFISTKNSNELQRQRKLVEDSIANVTKPRQLAESKKDTAKTAAATGPVDTTGFNAAFVGAEHLVTVENELMKVVFSNKGGQPVSVELKQFKGYDSTSVKLVDPKADNRISYMINTNPNQPADIANLFFKDGQVVKNSDGSQTISFR